MNKEIKSYTHVALVLDASGSMADMRNATIRTMKEFFTALKSPEDKTIVDLWQFDECVRHLLDSVDINSGMSSAIENYTIGGCTALYDAICIGIDSLGAKFEQMKEVERPDAVVFAILTDGFENASQNFNLNDVKRRIEHQAQKYSWTFRFLAANQDAVLTGNKMGLDFASCETIEASGAGIKRSVKKMASFCRTDVRMRARKCREAKFSVWR